MSGAPTSRLGGRPNNIAPALVLLDVLCVRKIFTAVVKWGSHCGFNVFMPPNICAVCLVVLSTDKKKQMWSLRKTQAMWFFKYNRGVFGWFPAKINNPVSSSQVRFEQFRVIELHTFCVEDSNKRSDRRAFQCDLEFLMTVHLEQGCSTNKKGVGTHRKIAIVKQLWTHFKAKYEEGAERHFHTFPAHNTPDLERQYRHFRLCANWLTLFHHFLVTGGDGGLTSGLA